jgi:hypothetical protein
MNALLLFAYLCFPLVYPASRASETVCEVTGFYETVYSETGFKVLTTTGELAAVDVLMKPAKPDEGSYEIKVTRKAPNLYLVVDCNQTGKIVANKLYIETRYCHEFANYDKAKLLVTGNFGMVKGKITFK